MAARKTRPKHGAGPDEARERTEPAAWEATLPKAPVVREARFEFRSTNEQKAIIEHAAMLRGMTMADYVRSTVLERAAEDVHRMHVTTLSIRDWERFMDLLENPPPPNDRLLRAAARYRTIVEHSDGLDDLP